MYVSHDSAEQTAQRLLQVIGQADFKVCEQAYVFEDSRLMTSKERQSLKR